MLSLEGGSAPEGWERGREIIDRPEGAVGGGQACKGAFESKTACRLDVLGDGSVEEQRRQYHDKPLARAWH